MLALLNMEWIKWRPYIFVAINNMIKNILLEHVVDEYVCYIFRQFIMEKQSQLRH